MEDHYTVRAVTELDLDTILQIFNECILDHTTLLYYETKTIDYIQKWYQECRAGGYPAIAVVEKSTDKPVAYAYYTRSHPFPAFNLSTMMAIYIQSSHRRRGLGRLLVSEMLKIAKAMRFKNVVVYISSENTASIKLFESFQFKFAGKEECWAYNFGKFIDGLTFQYVIPETTVDQTLTGPPKFVPFAWDSYVFAVQ
ncbi:acyl-CoA N-acyltransferase [Fennellomyces sp. T-0311]|nr:acyl-CoA N-acyltransferase [Fennellomyces sp. T-0311]